MFDLRIVTESPRNSIFIKIVLTFLALLAPMYALNMYMNESGQRSVRNEIVSSMNAKVELYVNLIESEFQRVIKQIEAYVNDDDLMKLSTAAGVMSDIERTDKVLALKSKLDLVMNSNSFVENVTAFIPLLNRSISSRDNAITAFNVAQYEALSVPTNRFESPYLVWEDRIFISMPYPDPPATGKKKPIFLLTVEISKAELRNVLRQFTNNGESAVWNDNHKHWSISSDDGMVPSEADREQYLAIAKSSGKLDATLSIFMPKRYIFGSLERYRIWMLLLTLLAIVIVVFFSFSIYRIIQRPLRTLLRSFNKVEQGNLNTVVHYQFKDEFGFLFNRFNMMVKELNVLVHEVYEHKYRLRLAELRQLQSQINPHFLYNSFFILHRMATLQDNDNIVRFTKYLGEYFQFITRDGMEETTLQIEVKYAQTYADIQSFRFGKRIQCRFEDLPAEFHDLTVPRLILQPLLENAYDHGLENTMADGRITVQFAREGERFVIAVEDNGTEMNEARLQQLRLHLKNAEQLSESTGMRNVHRRLQMKYGTGCGLTLKSGDRGGLRVEVRLRSIQEEDQHVPAFNRG
ncbi:sensor histidine kinase [Paenibacillus sp. GCM10027626]|uniref:sensor histidine kinase n=1 Tax=Paenibacillus sp. GCM10027626 TaxID=3273411 RepID=UPI00363F8D30